MEWDETYHKLISTDGRAVIEWGYYGSSIKDDGVWMWHVDYLGDDDEWIRLAEDESATEAQAIADAKEAYSIAAGD